MTVPSTPLTGDGTRAGERPRGRSAPVDVAAGAEVVSVPPAPKYRRVGVAPVNG